MNRRGFFRGLFASAALAASASTRLGQAALRIAEENTFTIAAQNYTDYLAQSMLETKEVLAANILSMYTHRTEALPFAIAEDVV